MQTEASTLLTAESVIAPESPTDAGRDSGWRQAIDSVWAVTAAFGVYFCMYGFRKPFTAGTYTNSTLWGLPYKEVLVIAQVFGYMISKFVGIRVVAEMPRHVRAWAILVLIAIAEAALVGFAIAPRPWNVMLLFVNGLPLGMVFGLVLGLLEGRRMTEALTAGLCASFILAGGVTKSVGTALLNHKVPEAWMPAAAGGIFAVPLIVGLVMLSRIRPPTGRDVAARSARTTMTRAEQLSLVWKFAPGLVPIVFMYLLVTILRSVRDDFAPELWKGLGVSAASGTYAASEAWVALGVIAVNGSAVLVRNNRRAFSLAMWVCIGGFVLLGGSLVGLSTGLLGPFWFMVLIGLGFYLPYVATHTTIFERMLAVTREKGNIGFLMTVVDAIGYLGYVLVLLAKNLTRTPIPMLPFLTVFGWVSAVVSIFCVAWSLRYFLTFTRTHPKSAAA